MGYFKRWLNWLTEPTLTELEAAAIAAIDHPGLWLALAEAYARERNTDRAEWAHARAMAVFRGPSGAISAARH